VENEMSNQQGVGAGGVLFAFITGAAVGAAVALLFAPAKGEETRDYLGQRAREGRERATEAARQGREMVNRSRENLTTAFDRAKDQFQAATRETGPDA
jgi:gas vesicle protein